MPSIQKSIALLLFVGAALSVGCQSAPNTPAESDAKKTTEASAPEKGTPKSTPKSTPKPAASSTDQRVGVRIETLGIT